MKHCPRFVLAVMIAAIAAVVMSAPAGALSVSPTSLAFGTQTVGTTSAPQTFTFSPFVFQGVSSIATTDPEFSFTASLATCFNGDNCPVTVTFTPTSAGAKTASILLVLTGVNAGTTQAISVTGTGVAGPPPALSESVWTIGLPVAGILLLFGVGLTITRRRRARVA